MSAGGGAPTMARRGMRGVMRRDEDEDKRGDAHGAEGQDDGRDDGVGEADGEDEQLARVDAAVPVHCRDDVSHTDLAS